MCYTDEKLTEDSWIRTFDPLQTDNEEYVWHRDKRDREVTVLEGSGWKFQFDDEVPFNININEKVHVPKMLFHRIIPSNTKLVIKITETD